MDNKPYLNVLPLNLQKIRFLNYRGNTLYIFADDESLPVVDLANKIDSMVTPSEEVRERINVSLKLSKSNLPESSDKITLPMLLNIDVGELDKNVKANMDVICLLDTSGSMKGEKINLLKNSFANIMDYLDDKDRMSIVTFSNTADRLTPLLRMSKQNKDKTLEAIKGISASGGKDITSAMRVALSIMKQRRMVNTVTSILILSDGLDKEAELGVKDLLNHYSTSMKETFTITTLGYGKDHDPQLMTALCQMKDGTFYFIDELDTVDEVFVDCFGKLISVVAEKVTMFIEVNDKDPMLPGIKLVKAYGVDGFWHTTGGKTKGEILQLMSGKQYDHVFEVGIPKLVDPDVPMKTFLIAKASIVFSDLNGQGHIKYCNCDITFQEEADDIEDEQVMNEYNRVKTAEVIKIASQLSEKKQFNEAKEKLKSVQVEMKKCKIQSKCIENYGVELDRAIYNVSPSVYQVKGRQLMMENYLANIKKCSNLNSVNNYMNNKQLTMNQNLKAKKYI
jgi:hypothetical protein